MQRLFFAFPAGLPGSGLLLLRVAATLMAFHEGYVLSITTAVPFPLLVVFRVLSAIAVLSILIGLATPVGSLVLTSEAATAFLLSFRACPRFTAPELLLLDLAVMTLVIAAVGPGAFSLDARLFGRREIVFPD